MRYLVSAARAWASQERELQRGSGTALHFRDPERFRRELRSLAALLTTAPTGTRFLLEVGDDCAFVRPDAAGSGGRGARVRADD